jgi:Sulfotransferase family
MSENTCHHDSTHRVQRLSAMSVAYFKNRKRDKIRYPVGKKTRRYLLSLWGSLKHKRSFDHVKTFCMFIGYPRSGHTLIGSLLDAHPNVILADELDALKFIQAGFGERQVFYLSLRNSRRSAAAGRIRTGYSYRVPNQWQGSFTDLQMIGDKMGGYTALRLQYHPALLDLVRAKFRVEIKFVHVMRNPYDVISTMSLQDNRPLHRSIDEFSALCTAVAYVRQRTSSANIYDLRHEDFISNPRTALKQLCDFFGLSQDDAYLAASASIVFKSPHRSRYDVPWNRRLIDNVQQKLERFPFLADYGYDKDPRP